METNPTTKPLNWEKTGIRTTYLIAFGIILIFTVYTYVVYGTGWIEILPQGTWLILGGFSLFYPTSGFQIICGILLILSMIASAKRLKITKNNDSLNFHERYSVGINHTLEVNRTDITRISLETGTPGKRIWWALIWGLHIAYLLTDGVFLITNPFVFGYGISNAWLYIITSLLDLVILILILWSDEVILDIETGTQVIHLEITAAAVNLTEILEITDQSTTIKPRNRTLVWLGLGFLFIAITARIFNWMFGTAVRVPIFLLGLILVVWGVKNREIWNRVFTPASSNTIKTRFNGEPLAWMLELVTLPMIGITLAAWIRFVPWSLDFLIYSSLLLWGSVFIICSIIVLWSYKTPQKPKLLILLIGLILVGFIFGLFA